MPALLILDVDVIVVASIVSAAVSRPKDRKDPTPVPPTVIVPSTAV